MKNLFIAIVIAAVSLFGFSTATASAAPYTGRIVDPAIFKTSDPEVLTDRYMTNVFGLQRGADYVTVNDSSKLDDAQRNNPNKLVLNTEYVVAERHVSVVMPAFVLGIAVHTWRSTTIKPLMVNPNSLMAAQQQAFAAGEAVNKFGQLTGLNVEPGSATDKAIQGHLHVGANGFADKQQAYQDLLQSYNNAFETNS